MQTLVNTHTAMTQSEVYNQPWVFSPYGAAGFVTGHFFLFLSFNSVYSSSSFSAVAVTYCGETEKHMTLCFSLLWDCCFLSMA